MEGEAKQRGRSDCASRFFKTRGERAETGGGIGASTAAVSHVRDGSAVDGGQRDETGVDSTVLEPARVAAEAGEEDGAGAAASLSTAELCAGEAAHVAEIVQQGCVDGGGCGEPDADAVEVEEDVVGGRCRRRHR
jgi:hypothetical protein